MYVVEEEKPFFYERKNLQSILDQLGWHTHGGQSKSSPSFGEYEFYTVLPSILSKFVCCM